MVSHQDIFQDIQSLTTQLISIRFSVQLNFPTMSDICNNIYEINYAGMSDISIALKNLPYEDIYNELERRKNYNIKMIDGALIQMLYRYEQTTLISHRLAFFPSPDLEAFQNEPEIYEEDEIYADILDKNIVAFPIRFDYDPANFQEIEHPKCHLTLGQFKNCRIPVSLPLTPSIFIAFLLRNFYNTAFQKYSDQINFQNLLFDETITDSEKSLLHIAIYSSRQIS
jgi:hypothetical protein